VIKRVTWKQIIKRAVKSNQFQALQTFAWRTMSVMKLNQRSLSHEICCVLINEYTADDVNIRSDKKSKKRLTCTEKNDG